MRPPPEGGWLCTPDTSWWTPWPGWRASIAWSSWQGWPSSTRRHSWSDWPLGERGACSGSATPAVVRTWAQVGVGRFPVPVYRSEMEAAATHTWPLCGPSGLRLNLVCRGGHCFQAGLAALLCPVDAFRSSGPGNRSPGGISFGCRECGGMPPLPRSSYPRRGSPRTIAKSLDSGISELKGYLA